MADDTWEWTPALEPYLSGREEAFRQLMGAAEIEVTDRMATLAPEVAEAYESVGSMDCDDPDAIGEALSLIVIAGGALGIDVDPFEMDPATSELAGSYVTAAAIAYTSLSADEFVEIVNACEEG
jgi:hypothetical protein